MMALLVLPCVAYFEVDTTSTVDDRCPFSWPEYHFDEEDMSTADADILFSCNAPPSDAEIQMVSNSIANGVSVANATANLCFGRGCWWAGSVTMEATISIPPGELMHNGFPFSNTFNLTNLPGENVTGLCFPPTFMGGGGYLCLVDRPPKSIANRRQLAPDAGSSTWLLSADYVPVAMDGFTTPQVDNQLKTMILIAAAILIALILLGFLSGGSSSKSAPPPQL